MKTYQIELKEFDTFADVFTTAPKLSKKDIEVYIVFLTDTKMTKKTAEKDTAIIKEEMVEYGICNTDTVFTYDIAESDEYSVLISIMQR